MNYNDDNDRSEYSINNHDDHDHDKRSNIKINILKDKDSITCTHPITQQAQISGDLICTDCGQVLQTNSQLSTQPGPLDRGHFPSISSTAISTTLSHQDRSELSLRILVNQLICTYALKPSYAVEAIDLMHQYWQHRDPKIKYGHGGNRLLVAILFLLSRRDHLAINLTLLAASIDSSPQDCGVFFEALTALNPSLKTLATAADFTEKSLDLLINELKSNFNLCIHDTTQLYSLRMKIEALSNLIQDTERGSSRSAESTALAATWLTLSSLRIPKLPLEAAVSNVCVSTTLSLKTVKVKYSQIVDKLTERAKELLPTTFATIQTQNKTQRLALLLDNLSLLLGVS